MTRSPQPRPGILDIAPYIGGEAKVEGVDRIIRLASNESALGPSPRAMAAYRALAGELHRYPDGGSVELRHALAKRYGLDAARIVCGTGSDELIQLLARCYAGPGDEVLYSRHGFLMYPISTQAAGATPIAIPEVSLTADVDAILARVSIRGCRPRPCSSSTRLTPSSSRATITSPVSSSSRKPRTW
jgi:histidinol-phosphate aminotransferase